MAKKRKRKLGKSSQVTRAWIELKPYSALTSYDRYYINQSELVLGILKQFSDLFRHFEIGQEELPSLACILTSYFEDFINEIGIWSVFTQRNKTLYGYYLPFYDIGDYDPEYLNPADFQYIVWHWIGKVKGNEIIAPDMPDIYEIGLMTYELLEAEIDNAPVTDYYQKIFRIPDEINFFELKTILKWFTKSCYVPGSIEMKYRLLEGALEFMETMQEDTIEFQNQMLYALEEDYIFKFRTSFSALSITEWFAQLIDGSDYIKEQIKHTKKRLLSFFIFEGHNEDYWEFKHVQTDKNIKVVRKSVNIDLHKNNIGDCCSLQLVQWKGEWWLSGTFLNIGINNKDFIEQQRKDFSSIPYHIYTEEEKAKLHAEVASEEELFLKFYKQKMVFFDNQKALQEQMNAFMAYCNEHRVKDKKAADLAQKKYDALKGNKEGGGEDWKWEEGKKICQFYVSGTGSIMTQDIPNTIKLMEKDELTLEEETILFCDLFSELNHPEISQYLIENHSTKNLFYPIPLSEIKPIDYVEFLLRYWNPDEFREAIPNMRYMPGRE